MVSLKQYRTPGAREEITTLISDMLQTGALVPTNSLYDNPVWPVKQVGESQRLTVEY